MVSGLSKMLEVTYKGVSIADVLDMTVDQTIQFLQQRLNLQQRK